MRYLRVEWLGRKPDNKELVDYLRHMFGKMGLIESKFRVVEDLLACEAVWVEKIRGALALKWQFNVLKIGGTQKGARSN
ncbi:MAG: hypothetical protein GOV00_01450 [Candidatus Altiarchaeota archaeon]|nr:hypothetical protein [Candidatus Altiarchaeota archaeon]